MAFLLYLAIAFIGVPKLLPYIGEIGEKTPAQHAKLQKGDRVLRIDNTPIAYWEEIGEAINEANEPTITLLIERNATQMRLLLTPKRIEDKNIFGETINRRIIGISPLPRQTTVSYGFGNAIGYAWEQTLKASTLIFQSVQKLLTGVVSRVSLPLSMLQHKRVMPVSCRCFSLLHSSLSTLVYSTCFPSLLLMVGTLSLTSMR